ncbi:dirigent protein 25-like isoform X2 [Lotus japonicus]|nr:dirigent protein 25-like isoform X2 [Lotus japonicus]
MAKLLSLPPILMLFLFMTTINKSSSARTLANPSPNHHHDHHRITFLMQYMLNDTSPSENPTTKVTGKIPFPKPLGFFPPIGGIPIPQSTSSSTQTLDLSSIGFSFPSTATLQELEYGSVISIDEELLEGDGDEVKKMGKAQGVYVAGSEEDGSSHMVALTASFEMGDYQDGLRLFGVHRTDVYESHVAVIGGTGKYNGANGYAAVKVVDSVGSSTQGTVTSSKFLSFDVYLSYYSLRP